MPLSKGWNQSTGNGPGTHGPVLLTPVQYSPAIVLLRPRTQNQRELMKRDKTSIQLRTNDSVSVHTTRRELLSLREVADTLFRQYRTILALCTIFTVAIAAYLWFSPRIYEAEMTILVKNTRADLIVTPDGRSTAIPQPEINDSQMATEIQLLSSADLFRKVVDQCDLGGMTPASHEKATAMLQKKVRIAPVMKSSMIRVRYASPDAKMSAQVLQALADVYFERHLQIHSNAGSFAFFQQQAEAYEQKVKDAEARLVEFQNTSGVVGAPEQKDLLIRKVVEEQAALREAQANRSETQKRVAGLRSQLAGLAPRITTQTRQIPNQYSVERLNTLLVELQNKRTELLTKFKPNDRMVTQVDRQISDTQKALESSEKLSAKEEATDVNPLRQTLETELARAETSAQGLSGRIETLSQQTKQYRTELEKLEGIRPGEQELLREIKVAEENYLLYSKKREEARIGEALDQQKIANVAFADPPRVPVLPLPKFGVTVFAGYAFGIIVIFGGALGIGQYRRTVFTPWELETFAGLPVLGTVALRSPKVVAVAMGAKSQ
jgi:uncharacterized protein involved in exopolysaccharide biosynthesis